MPEYDINDPTDIDIIHANFDIISNSDWEEYIVLAESYEMGYKNINMLKNASRKAGISKYLSAKVMKWVLSLVDEIDERREDE